MALHVRDGQLHQAGLGVHVECIGERGEVENVGFGKPVGLLILWGTGVAVVAIVVLFVLGAIRRALAGRGDDDGHHTDWPDGGSVEDLGVVAPPTEDYGGQPPLIT